LGGVSTLGADKKAVHFNLNEDPQPEPQQTPLDPPPSSTGKPGAVGEHCLSA
jgi:hypothetical protein